MSAIMAIDERRCESAENCRSKPPPHMPIGQVAQGRSKSYVRELLHDDGRKRKKGAARPVSKFPASYIEKTGRRRHSLALID